MLVRPCGPLQGSKAFNSFICNISMRIRDIANCVRIIRNEEKIMPSICIQNLGKYNEGELWFEWVEMPVSEEELDKVYDRIKICHGDKMYYDDCGNPYEEIMIVDWEYWGNYPISEWSNIEELNEVAEFLNDLSDIDEEVFDYYMSNGYSFEDAKEKVESQDYSFIEADDDTDLAYKYIDECYGGIENLDRETLERYFDFESFGRDLSYDYYQTDSGYLLAA